MQSCESFRRLHFLSTILFYLALTFYSHRTLLNEEVKEPTEAEKQTVKLLLEHLIDNAKFWKEAE